MSYQAPALPTPLQVNTMEDATVLVARIESAMEGLIELVESETELVRSGRYLSAGELETQKTAYARAYVQLAESAKASEETLRELMPEKIASLRVRHEQFKELLSENMTALAAARDVTRSLVDTVADAVGASNAPKTYGAAGTMNEAPQRRPSGIAVNRSL